MASQAKVVHLDPFAGFVPLPTQERFLTWVPPNPMLPDLRLLSSGYGGGKSAIGCRESIRYAMAFSHSRHVVSRFHYDDLRDTTMVTYFEALERIGLNDGSKPGRRHYIYTKAPRPEIKWWNGATTLFRNLDDPTGSKYGSMEVNTWFIDEGFEVPEGVLRVIYPSRLRWHLRGCDSKQRIAEMVARGEDPAEVPCRCPRRMWACTNPGPNAFLKSVVKGQMQNAGWFPVPPGENVYAGAGYYEALSSQGEAYGDVWKARFVDGSWDAFEGQRFTMLDRKLHILKHDLNPDPSQFDIVEGHDFGFRNPHATIWIAVHKEREYPPIIFDWYSVAQREIPDHAKAIRARREQYGFNHHDILAVGDPAGSQTRGSGVSDIMLFAAHGVEIIPMTRAKMPDARADLLALMFSREVKTRDGAMRGLMFTPRTKPVFDRFIEYRYRDASPSSHEDAPEKFVKKDDHEIDAAGYAVSAIPDPLDRDAPAGHSEHIAAEIEARRIPTGADLDARELANNPYDLGWD